MKLIRLASIFVVLSCAQVEPINGNKDSSDWILVQGKISKSKVRSELEKYHDDIQFCYERKLVAMPEVEGTLVMEWGVDQEGRTKDIKVLKSKLSDQTVYSCLKSVIRKMSFEPSKSNGKIIISYPFEFVSRPL